MTSFPPRDRERVARALEARRRAKRHERRFGVDWTTDEAAVDAISKAIEEVGENLAAVSAETRAAHPEVPWRGIAGTRNVLVHGYHLRDLDIVRDIVENHLPKLIAELEALELAHARLDLLGGHLRL